MPTRSPWLSRLAWIVCGCCVCALGMFCSLRPLVGPDGSRLPGDLIDSRFVGYVLEHGWLWLTGRVDGFWSAPFYYPLPRTLALSDNMAGALPLYAVLRAVTLGPDQAMLCLVLAFFGLNFALAVWCFRRFGAGCGPCLVAAYPVAFGLTVTAFSMHPQCFQLYPELLCLGLLGRWLVAPTPRGLGLLAVGLTFLALSSFYFLMFFLLLAGLAVCLAVVSGLASPAAVRASLRFSPKQYAVLGGCLFLLGLNYWPYYRESLETGPWPAAMAGRLSPRMLSFLAAPAESPAWGWLDKPGWGGAAGNLFPGLFPVVGMLFGGWLLMRMWRGKGASGRPGELAGGVLAVAAALTCASFTHGSGLDALLQHLPGFSALRATGRVLLVAVPCFGLGLALLVDRATRRLSAALRGGALLLALVLVVADQYVLPEGFPSHSRAESAARVASLMRRVPPEARIFYVDPGLPIGDSRYWAVHLDAMLAAQRLGKATYNGYSGWLPPLLGVFYDRKTCRRLDAWRGAAAWLYYPAGQRRGLYAGSAFLDFPDCPPDQAILDRPQGRERNRLPARDRKARIQATASYSRASGRLAVEALVQDLGSRPLYGLGDFSHRLAVFLVADVTDATGARRRVPLGRLDQTIAPGQTVAAHAVATIGSGSPPRTVEVMLMQAGGGAFDVSPESPTPVRIDP